MPKAALWPWSMTALLAIEQDAGRRPTQESLFDSVIGPEEGDVGFQRGPGIRHSGTQHLQPPQALLDAAFAQSGLYGFNAAHCILTHRSTPAPDDLNERIPFANTCSRRERVYLDEALSCMIACHKLDTHNHMSFTIRFPDPRARQTLTERRRVGASSGLLWCSIRSAPMAGCKDMLMAGDCVIRLVTSCGAAYQA